MSIFPQQIIRVSDKSQLNNSALLDSLSEGSIVYVQDTNKLYVKSNGIFQAFTVGSSDFYDDDKEIERGQKRRRK